MTSDPDNAPRRPPTIDLTATEIESDKASAEAQSAPSADQTGPADAGDARAGSRTAGPRQSRLAGVLGGALGGAAVASALLLGLWLAGVLPPRIGAPAPAASTAQSANARDNELSARLDRLQAELQTRPPDTGLNTRLAGVEGQMKAVGDSLAAMTRRLDEIAVAAQGAGQRADAASAAVNAAAQNSVQRSDVDALDKRIADLQQAMNATAQNTVQRSDVDALNKRIADLQQAMNATAQNTVQRSDVDALSKRDADLQQTVNALSNEVTHRLASANDRAARTAVAAEALRSVVERGAPYQAELAAMKAFGVPPNATAPLEPFAATGVPGAAELSRELSQLTPELLKASGAPAGQTSFLGRLEDNARSLVKVTPVDAPASDDPRSVVARLNRDAARDDLAAALTDIGRLPPSAQAIVAPWVAKVQARDAAITASRTIAAGALAALPNSNGNSQ